MTSSFERPDRRADAVMKEEQATINLKLPPEERSRAKQRAAQTNQTLQKYVAQLIKKDCDEALIPYPSADDPHAPAAPSSPPAAPSSPPKAAAPKAAAPRRTGRAAG